MMETRSVQSQRIQHGKNAIVIGASMAGLLVGRVLSDFYERVTIIERDPLEQGCNVRKGVPQGGHVHVVLVGGANAIQSLFPGLFDQLALVVSTMGSASVTMIFWACSPGCRVRSTRNS